MPGLGQQLTEGFAGPFIPDFCISRGAHRPFHLSLLKCCHNLAQKRIAFADDIVDGAEACAGFQQQDFSLVEFAEQSCDLGTAQRQPRAYRAPLVRHQRTDAQQRLCLVQ